MKKQRWRAQNTDRPHELILVVQGSEASGGFGVFKLESDLGERERITGGERFPRKCEHTVP